MTLLKVLPGNIAQGLIWGVMALGVFMTYKILDFADLTVDGSFATGGAVAVMLTLRGVPCGAALAAAVLAGGLTGLVTALLHTKLGIPGILSSILTQIALYSVNLNILGKANQAVSVDKFMLIISSRYPTPAIITGFVFAAVVVFVLYWFFGTEIGCAIRATGCGESMAKAQGISTDSMKILTLVISNALVGMSGALSAQYQGFADINMGRGAIVIGLAAVIIGDVLFHTLFRRHGNFAVRMFFVVIGSILYYIAMGVVIWLKMPTNDMKLFTAVIVAVFLCVPYLKEKHRSSFSRAAKKAGETHAEA